MVDCLRIIARRLPFEVIVRELEGGDDLPLHDGRLGTLALDHSVPCLGYRSISREPAASTRACSSAGRPRRHLEAAPARRDGTRRQPASWDQRMFSGRPDGACGWRTRPTPARRPIFRLSSQRRICSCARAPTAIPADAENAVTNHHMLFSESATIARDADAQRLWLTHFSAKMLDPERYAEHATGIFPGTTIGHEGLSLTLSFEDVPAGPA